MAVKFPAKAKSLRMRQRLPLGGAGKAVRLCLSRALRGQTRRPAPGSRPEKALQAGKRGAVRRMARRRVPRGGERLKCPPRLPGCGTQHPLRALGGTRVLLAAAPTTPPCFRHWRRSSSLQRKNYFNFGVLKRLRLRSLFRIPFSRVGQCSKAVRHSPDGLAALIGKD